LKAICLKQPYASLIAEGKKTIETRTWATKYRGDILIVASKSPKVQDLPTGVALAVATIINCRPMVKEDEGAACCEIYPRAVAWELTNIRPVVSPYPVEGQLGIFDVDVLGGGAPTRVPISEASTASTAIAAALRVAGYCRVSTEEQAQEGVSMDAQRKYIIDWCQRMHWNLRAIYKDPGFSGKDRERPKLKQMMEDASVGFEPTTKSRDPLTSMFDMVVAYNNDRLSRDVKDTLSIIDELAQLQVGVRFGVISNVDLTSPEGRFLLTNLAAGAEFYRRDIAQKVKMSMDSLKGKGRHMGRVPWGFKVNEQGILEVEDQRVLTIWKLYYWPPHVPVSRIAQQMGLQYHLVWYLVRIRSKVLAAWAAAGIAPASLGSS